MRASYHGLLGSTSGSPLTSMFCLHFAQFFRHCHHKDKITNIPFYISSDDLQRPSSLVVVCFGSSPIPLPPLPSASCLSFSIFICLFWTSLLTGEGGRSLIKRWRESLVLYKFNHSKTAFFISSNIQYITSGSPMKEEKKTILQSNNMVELRVIYLHPRYGMVQ